MTDTTDLIARLNGEATQCASEGLEEVAVLLHEAAQALAASHADAEDPRLAVARDALEEIALAGMSGSGQESPEGMRDWHARRAWEFIGIAARALDAIKAAAPAPAVQAVAHVGDSDFEGWFSTYTPHGKGDKQRARDAYVAGMGDRSALAAAPVAPQAAQVVAWLVTEWGDSGSRRLTFDPQPKPIPLADEARGVRYYPLALAAPVAPQAAPADNEFTVTAREALAWVLWHHLGGSSPVGQPIRFALGMGQHERMSEIQIEGAKRWARATGSATEEFHRAKAAPVAQPLTDERIVDEFCRTPNIHQFVSAFVAGVRFAERAHGITAAGQGQEGGAA